MLSVFSTISTSFPQEKIAEPPCFLRDREYASNQRKRDLPEGESRQGAIGRTGNGTQAVFGKLDADGWNRENSYNQDVTTEEAGKRGFTLAVPGDSGVIIG